MIFFFCLTRERDDLWLVWLESLVILHSQMSADEVCAPWRSSGNNVKTHLSSKTLKNALILLWHQSGDAPPHQPAGGRSVYVRSRGRLGVGVEAVWLASCWKVAGRRSRAGMWLRVGASEFAACRFVMSLPVLPQQSEIWWNLAFRFQSWN